MGRTIGAALARAPLVVSLAAEQPNNRSGARGHVTPSAFFLLLKKTAIVDQYLDFLSTLSV